MHNPTAERQLERRNGRVRCSTYFAWWRWLSDAHWKRTKLSNRTNSIRKRWETLAPATLPRCFERVTNSIAHCSKFVWKISRSVDSNIVPIVRWAAESNACPADDQRDVGSRDCTPERFDAGRCKNRLETNVKIEDRFCISAVIRRFEDIDDGERKETLPDTNSSDRHRKSSPFASPFRRWRHGEVSIPILSCEFAEYVCALRALATRNEIRDRIDRDVVRPDRSHRDDSWHRSPPLHHDCPARPSKPEVSRRWKREFDLVGRNEPQLNRRSRRKRWSTDVVGTLVRIEDAVVVHFLRHIYTNNRRSGDEHSLTNARATSVLPVPGGP